MTLWLFKQETRDKINKRGNEQLKKVLDLKEVILRLLEKGKRKTGKLDHHK